MINACREGLTVVGIGSTLINVDAVNSVTIVSCVACASEPAIVIVAGAELGTVIGVFVAFVNVNTFEAFDISGSNRSPTGSTFAGECAVIVCTVGMVVAAVGSARAFVYVNAVTSSNRTCHGFVAIYTSTSVAACVVFAGGKTGMTLVCGIGTFVNVRAADAISSPTRVTSAGELNSIDCHDFVGTSGLSVAVV